MRTKDEESRSIDTLPVSARLLQMLQTLVERRFNKVIVATICVIEPGNGKSCAVQHLPATGERVCKTQIACQPGLLATVTACVVSRRSTRTERPDGMIRQQVPAAAAGFDNARRGRLTLGIAGLAPSASAQWHSFKKAGAVSLAC